MAIIIKGDGSVSTGLNADQVDSIDLSSVTSIEEDIDLSAPPSVTTLAPEGIFYFYWGGTGATPDEVDLVTETLIDGVWRDHPHRFWQTAGPAGHASGLIISTGTNIRFSHGALGTLTVKLTRLNLGS